MTEATDTYLVRFHLTDRDMTVGDIKRTARGQAWQELSDAGCIQVGPSEATIDHDSGTVLVAVPVQAPTHLPRNTPTPI